MGNIWIVNFDWMKQGRKGRKKGRKNVETF